MESQIPEMQTIDHFSPIGFLVESEDDLAELIVQIKEAGEPIPVKKGTYIKWSGKCGAELWLQADRRNNSIGMSPHFSGTARMQVGLAAKARRPYDSALEGVFKVWADPPVEDPTDGAYPFVFNAPDFARYSEVRLPSLASAQISAFAEKVAVYESPESHLASQTGERKLASQSFAPLGLFPGKNSGMKSAVASAFFSGHVLKAEEKVNDLSAEPFFWALVETWGAVFDVVIASSMIDDLPVEGGVISGSFWLSGRLLEYTLREPSRLRRLFGRK